MNKKGNMHHKKIAANTTCPRCDAPCEDVSHLALLCLTASQVWIDLELLPDPDLQQLCNSNMPPGLDPNIWPSAALLVLWKQWDLISVFCVKFHTAKTTIRNIVFYFSLWIFIFMGILCVTLLDHRYCISLLSYSLFPNVVTDNGFS